MTHLLDSLLRSTGQSLVGGQGLEPCRVEDLLEVVPVQPHVGQQQVSSNLAQPWNQINKCGTSSCTSTHCWQLITISEAQCHQLMREEIG